MKTEFVADPFNLKRFVRAQAQMYAQALSEIRHGRKQSHWMWFIFPQIAGLGSSSTAQHFALSGTEEATAYLGHSLLGPRLRECTKLVCEAPAGATLETIFGYADHLKFWSSMTLFHAAAPDEPAFRDALDRFRGGEPDRKTLALLS